MRSSFLCLDTSAWLFLILAIEGACFVREDTAARLMACSARAPDEPEEANARGGRVALAAERLATAAK